MEKEMKAAGATGIDNFSDLTNYWNNQLPADKAKTIKDLGLASSATATDMITKLGSDKATQSKLMMKVSCEGAVVAAAKPAATSSSSLAASAATFAAIAATL